MEPQGRTIASPSRTRRQSKTLCLEKTTPRVRDYVQTVGLNAETKEDRHRAEGEIFVLTFPFIGPYRKRLASFYSLPGCQSRHESHESPVKNTQDREELIMLLRMFLAFLLFTMPVNQTMPQKTIHI